MQSSLYTGVSGLNANMTKLSVIGNNIANVNTVGFKSSRVNFEDILSQSITGNSQIGTGVTVSGIQKMFTQGDFETTGNTLDMAISGDGFFVVEDPTLGTTYYTRAGQFELDKDGYIVDQNGYRVQGYMASSSGTLQNTLSDLLLTTKTISPNSTTSVDMTANLDSNSEVTGFVFTTGSNDVIRYSVDGGTTYITASLTTDGGLSSGSAYTGSDAASAIEAALEATNGSTDTYTVTYDDQTGLFTVTNDSGNANTLLLDWANAASTSASLLGYTTSTAALAAGSTSTSDTAAGDFFLDQAGDTSNFSTPVTVYDSLGNSHTATLYFRKSSLDATGNTWEWYAVVDAEDSYTGSTEVQAQGTVSFNSSGALYSESATTYPTGGFDFTSGTTQNQNITFDFGTSVVEGGTGTDGTTQYATSSGVTSLSQDGYSSGSLESINIDQDGVITGIFSNGKELTLAQIVLANFSNPGGLASVGNNLYSETYDSGQALVGEAGSSGLGTVESSTLELSNVDIAQEFVNMIAAQRGFQANSKIVTVTDELLSEIVNLKR